MTDVERRGGAAPVPAEWTYAPAPESRDVVSLRERYGLFVGGEWLEPRAGERYTTISPADEEPLAEIAQAERRGRRERGRRRARGVRRVVGAARERAREVPVPDRAHPPGALARVRGARVAERRQADQGVARRRPAARGRALLLLRGLGRQARVRVPEPPAAAARRRRPDHPVELPAADARVEDRAGARDREHRRAEAGRDDAADGAPLLRRPPPGRAAARRRQHRHRRRARPAPRSSTPTSTRSRSPARPRSARRSSGGSPAPARS